MSKTKTSLDEEFAKLKEDEETEWWRPTKRDNFNLTNKLMRSGCRSLNRKYIRCLREGEEGFAECQVFFLLKVTN